MKGKSQPKGYKDGEGIKLAIKFEPNLFQKIKDRATKQKKGFSEIVNDACKCGLLDLEESERDEPDYVVELPQFIKQ